MRHGSSSLFPTLSPKLQFSSQSCRLRCLHVPRPRIDLKYVRDNVDAVVKNCKQRNLRISKQDVQAVVESYNHSASVNTKLNATLSERKAITEALKNASVEKRTELLQQAGKLKPEIQQLEAEKAEAEALTIDLAAALPNTTHASTPVGDESKIRILDYINEENQYTSDTAQDHVEIARKLDLVDFETAAKTAGTGFYYLKNEAVLLELALTQYALSKAAAAGFTMMRCPDLIRSEFVPACGFQPRDNKGQQIYETDNGNLSLVGTAEIPLAALGVDKIFSQQELPQRYVAVGRAFRAEAGARGADTRGLFRVHEFTKIELFSFTTREQADKELDLILDLQKTIVKELGLCARRLEMPTEELGASAHRKFDIEAWIPSRNDWGEITSASNCSDYQARRLNARYRRTVPTDESGQPPASSMEFVHTLNATAIAVPRVLVAGFESWFSHGRIKIPACLQPFMGGMSEIGEREAAE